MKLIEKERKKLVSALNNLHLIWQHETGKQKKELRIVINHIDRAINKLDILFLYHQFYKSV